MNSECGDNFAQVERMFLAALKHPKSERADFLAHACPDNAALRREVEQLLEADAADGPLDCEVPCMDFSSLADQFVQHTPKQIGPFQVIGIIASGGMGSVYEAQQVEPRRKVAVKVLRRELATREALLRFQFESQLLARLRHPGIAPIFETGIHREAEFSLPYYAMELIEGARSITEYVVEKQLPYRRRLELFADVCDAVDHAHQQRVVHRDLKPSNILVGGDDIPRVIDFGVAYADADEITIASPQTRTGQLIGTLQYMSPEQCQGNGAPVDTRSDVYALGVVLFELVTGQLPYDLSGKSVYDATTTVVEAVPTRLRAIDRRLPSELETIVHKALEKDPDRRYGAAGRLAEDIRRFLRGDAITARPPSVVYQLQVFARRHRILVFAMASVLISLTLGLIVSNIAFVKAERARTDSIRLSHELSNALSVAMETISSVNPTSAEITDSEELTTEQLLDRIAGLLDGNLDFGANSLDEAQLRLKLGRAYYHIGRQSDARRELQQAASIRREVLGIHPRVAECLLELASVASELGEENVSTRELTRIIEWYESGKLAKCQPVGIAYRRIAWDLNDTGEFRTAIDTQNRAIEVLQNVEGPDSLHIAWCINNRGCTFGLWKKIEEAHKDFQRALKMRLRVLGPDHSHTIHTYINLTGNALRRGELEEALRWAKQGWEGANRAPSIHENHPYYATAGNVYSDMLFRLEKFEAAVPILRETIACYERMGRKTHWQRRNLGICLLRSKEFEESEALLLGDYEWALANGYTRAEKAACERLITLFESWEKPLKLAAWKEKLATLAQQQSPASADSADLQTSQ